jgi:hypothetical protein
VRRLDLNAQQLIAEYLTNIAVAWFAAGVIGVFIGGAKSLTQIVFSVLWGIILSIGFLFAAIKFLTIGKKGGFK